MSGLPTEPGYYWARWIECEPNTEDHDLFEAREDWAPVEVTEDSGDQSLPPQERLRVFVLGFSGSQNLTFFEWGTCITNGENP